MLKFIKMKYHDAYLLYYSVWFFVIAVFTVIENFSANWSQRWNKIENSSGMYFLCLKFLISAGENWDTKVMLSLPNKMSINLISARLFKSINLIYSWTTSFVKKKKFKINKNEKKKKQERNLIPKSNRFVGD